MQSLKSTLKATAVLIPTSYMTETRFYFKLQALNKKRDLKSQLTRRSHQSLLITDDK